MPHYEFFCHNCKKLFAKVLSLADYERDKIACPKCGSKECRATLVGVYRDHVKKECVNARRVQDALRQFFLRLN